MKPTILLALDTSTEFCSVALAVATDKQTPAAPADVSSSAFSSVSASPLCSLSPRFFSRHEASGAAASQRILPAVREVFEEAQLTLRDCTAIAFGAGPGAFTGVRIAAGTALGLAFALQTPVVPVSTLMACAQAARARDPRAARVLAALDARMDEVYWALFEWQQAAADWRIVKPAAVSAPAMVDAGAPFTLAGNAATVFGARLAATARAASIDACASPDAISVANLGLRGLRAGRAVSAIQAAPEYVRNSVALTVAEREAMRAPVTKAAEITKMTKEPSTNT